MPGPTPAWTTSRAEYFEKVTTATGEFWYALISVAGTVRGWDAIAERGAGTGGISAGLQSGTSAGNELINPVAGIAYSSGATGIGNGRLRVRLYSDAARSALLQTLYVGPANNGDVPANAPNLRATQVLTTSADVDWIPHPFTFSPRRAAQYSDAFTLNGSRTAIYNRATRRYEAQVTGLGRNTSYTFAAAGATLAINTPGDPITYPAPTAVQISRTATSATLRFTAPSTGLNPYLQVELGGQWRTITGVIFTIGAGDQPWNPALTATAQGAPYSFRARWVNSEGPTNGAAATITGRAEPQQPGPPSDLALSADVDSITATFGRPAGFLAPQSYEYVLRTAEVADLTELATATDRIALTAPRSSFTISSGITAYTRYYLYLRALRGTIAGGWSAAEVNTIPASLPDTTNITVAWDEVAGFGYEIRTDDRPEWVSASSPRVLFGLPPNTLVGVEVHAIWRGREGPAARTTQLTYPSRVQLSEPISRTPTSITWRFGQETIGTTINVVIRAGANVETVTAAPTGADRDWTWTATGGFLAAGTIVFTFTLANATGSGPAVEIPANLRAGAPSFRLLAVTANRIRVGVGRDQYTGIGLTLQFRRGTGSWSDAVDFAGNLDPDNKGASFGGLSADTEYSIQARVLEPDGITSSPITEISVRTAPVQPSGVRAAGTYQDAQGTTRNTGDIIVGSAAVGDVFYVTYDRGNGIWTSIVLAERLTAYESTLAGSVGDTPGPARIVITPGINSPISPTRYRVHAFNGRYSVPAVASVPNAS